MIRVGCEVTGFDRFAVMKHLLDQQGIPLDARKAVTAAGLMGARELRSAFAGVVTRRTGRAEEAIWYEDAPSEAVPAVLIGPRRGKAWRHGFVPSLFETGTKRMSARPWFSAAWPGIAQRITTMMALHFSGQIKRLAKTAGLEVR